MTGEQRRSAIAPLVRQVTVALAPERAFDLFTRRVDTWWPLASHSMGGATSRALRLDEDGFVETLGDGRECPWGSVLAWEPPSRLAVTWHPGGSAETATLVEVTFVPEGSGTLVRLVHSGWERLPADRLGGPGAYGGYAEGWTYVLGRLAATAPTGWPAEEPA
jgi:uncharacterized protein YndB with AHSA1/START domain